MRDNEKLDAEMELRKCSHCGAPFLPYWGSEILCPDCEDNADDRAKEAAEKMFRAILYGNLKEPVEIQVTKSGISFHLPTQEGCVWAECSSYYTGITVLDHKAISLKELLRYIKDLESV